MLSTLHSHSPVVYKEYPGDSKEPWDHQVKKILFAGSICVSMIKKKTKADKDGTFSI